MECGDGKRGRCRSEGVTYEISCKGCEGKYIGETSRNAFTRGQEHKYDLQKKDRKSPLVMHNLQKHDTGHEPGFIMKITGVFGGDATKRQIQESVLIQKTNKGHLINRQDEWRQVKLPRLQVY